MPHIETNGIRMHYTERGSGQPLILLMGLGADGSLWESHVRAYETSFRCILVDNRGAGLSDKPNGPYSTAEMAKDTIGLMNALNIQQAHLSGISLGSAIAQEVALQASERVISLTLHCPWSRCNAYATRVFETLRAAYEAMSAEDFQKLLQLFIYTPDHYEHSLQELIQKQEVAKSNTNSMPVHAFQAQCDASISHRTDGRLMHVKVPTLITVGEEDRFISPSLARSIAEEIPGAELAVFERSGHTHHWDRLEQFNQLTLAFLRGE
jgi:pimeloyl-ACP methyl ester carboxylesterase